MPGQMITRKEGGGFEVVDLPRIHSVRVCVALRGGRFADAWFEDETSGEKFYAFGIDCPAPVDIGLHDGHAWYKWVWAWEDTREADEALARNPAILTDDYLDRLVARIDAFIQAARSHPVKAFIQAVRGHPVEVSPLDITGSLEEIGCGCTIYPFPKEAVARDYQQYLRLKASRR